MAQTLGVAEHARQQRSAGLSRRVSGGSVALTLKSFSACRMTMTVVELAVPQTHAANTAKLKPSSAASAVSQIGVKKGRR